VSGRLSAVSREKNDSEVRAVKFRIAAVVVSLTAMLVVIFTLGSKSARRGDVRSVNQGERIYSGRDVWVTGPAAIWDVQRGVRVVIASRDGLFHVTVSVAGAEHAIDFPASVWSRFWVGYKDGNVLLHSGDIGTMALRVESAGVSITPTPVAFEAAKQFPEIPSELLARLPR
jgi:hypothetical protein